MKIKKMITNSIVGDVNTYILISNKECFIIDPAFNMKKITKYIEENELNVKGILLTHGHFDHSLLITELSELYLCEVYLHKDEIELLKTETLNGVYQFNINKKINYDKTNFVLLKDFDKILLGEEIISIIHTPGHTQGSCVYIVDNIMISGDTLFKGTIGRYDLPTGNKQDIFNSLIKIVENTKMDTTVYPGHGENTTIKNELSNNPYFQYIKSKGDLI